MNRRDDNCLVEKPEIINENKANDALETFVQEAERIHKKRIRKIKVLKGIATLFILLGVLCLSGRESKAEIQHNIANEIIRFHVLANSDTEEDQALKLKVKNAVVLYMQGVLKGCDNKVEAEEMITSHKSDILQVAKQVIKEQGYDYQVTAQLENVYFPVKTYGDLTFPAGEYEAFRILIGQAEGKNWWCVMFPNLCMVNETYSIVPEDSKNQLRHVLTEEEYKSLSPAEEPSNTPTEEPSPSPSEKPKVEYRFWLADWVASLF